MAEERDLSKIPQCIKKLCGRIASPGPPTCFKSDCPGVAWLIKKAKKDNSGA